MPVEWNGRVQQLIVTEELTYDLLLDRISTLFSIDRDFLTSIYLDIMLEVWNPKTGKLQTIDASNFVELFCISSRVIFLVVDSNE